jgi:uncharacterized protein
MQEQQAFVLPNAKRVSSVDALRGFALFLVLITHFLGPFPGFPFFFTEDQLSALPTLSFDNTLVRLNQLLANDKARALFSFLFGLSFYFQMAKVERLGISFKKTFTRRMIILLAFGILHAYLLWWGDILRWYFFAGLVLLLCYKFRKKTIFALGILCMYVIPVVENIISPFLSYSPIELISASEAARGFLSDSYFEMIRANMLWDLNMNLNPWYRIPHTINILGYFFLGLWAGKASIFKKVDEYKSKYKLALALGFCTFMVSSYLIYRNPIGQDAHYLLSIIVRSIAGRLNIIGLLVLYVSGIVLLFHFTKARNILQLLIPVGQMTLTNYILHSVVGVFVFYGIGLGLMGRVGPSFVLPMALLFFSCQIGFSILWLKYFTMGPLEWVWRALMSGKFQSIRILEKQPTVYS